MTERWDDPFLQDRLNHLLDFRPEWDVPPLHASACARIVEAIRTSTPVEGQGAGPKIQVVVGPPGFGKTHLLGRIHHLLGDSALVAYVPALADPARPLPHLQWHVAEALSRRLADHPPSAPNGSVKRNGNRPHSIVELLALGQSEAGLAARRWLRGESVDESDSERLGILGDPPRPLELLQGIGMMVGPRVPLVLCCDQFEHLLKGRSEAAGPSVEAFLEILAKVPSLVLVLSCLDTQWPALKGLPYPAFLQRLDEPCVLEPMSELQAVELVGKRLSSLVWREDPMTLRWPFDEAALLGYVAGQQPSPRALINRSSAALQVWLDGERTELADIEVEETIDLPQAFLKHWRGRIAAVREDPECSPRNTPEDRLFRAILKVLTLAHLAKCEVSGVQVRALGRVKLKKGAEEGVSALCVEMLAGGEAAKLLVLATTLDDSKRFARLFNKVRAALGQGMAGAVLIHSASQFAMDDDTRVKFAALTAAGKLRLLGLDANPVTFECLEALLRVLDDAGNKRLVVAGSTLTTKDCQDLLLKMAVLEDFALFRMLTAMVNPVASVAAAAKPTPPAMVATGPVVIPVPAAPTATMRRPMPTLAAGTLAPAGPSYHHWCRLQLAKVVQHLVGNNLRVRPFELEPIEIGPAFARLKIVPVGSTSLAALRGQGRELKLLMGLENEPLVTQQVGCIGVDVELPRRHTVHLAEALVQPPTGSWITDPLFPLGIDVSGKAHWLNLADPGDGNVLVAGNAGSGKSEFLRAVVASLASRLSYEQVQFLLIDAKRITFAFTGQQSPYFYLPIARTLAAAANELKMVATLIHERSEMMTTEADKETEAVVLPRIVVVIDEVAGLVEDRHTLHALTLLLKQLGPKSSAAGIHVVLATHRPDDDVVRPLVCNNLPARVAFRLSKPAISELILNVPDAALLLGKGDLLWRHGESLVRLQGPLVAQNELEQLLKVN